MLAISLLYITFILLRYVLCVPDISKTFILKGCWILSEAFSASDEMIMWFLFFQFVYMVNNIDRFPYVESSLQLWDEDYLIMLDDLCDVFMDSVWEYFIELFCIYVHEES